MPLGITCDWLKSIGFQDRGLMMSVLIPPVDNRRAIVELFVDPACRGMVLCEKYHGGKWQVSLAQGVPDDPKVKDDHVLLTHKDYESRDELLELLRVLGVNIREHNG